MKTHYAEGRLSTEELEERIEDVYRSDTRSGMAFYLRDLPMWGLRRLIVIRARRLQRALLRMHLLTYATLNASLLGIWALTGEGVFWPAWLLDTQHRPVRLARCRLAAVDASLEPTALVDGSAVHSQQLVQRPAAEH